MKTYFRTLPLIPLLAVFFIFLTCGTLKAQEKYNLTYIVKEQGSILNIQPYILALDKSELNNHRLRTQRSIITFQGGLKIELFSADEIQKNGLPVSLPDYPESFPANRQEPVFALGANDFIIEYHIAEQKHH